MRMVAKIETELEFSKVFRQMLARYPDMRTVDPAFKAAPEGVDGVGMNGATRPFLPGVVDGSMPIAFLGQIAECPAFVRGDPRPTPDVLQDMGDNRIGPAVTDNAGDDLTAPLDHAEDDVLVILPHFVVTANKRLVGLDDALGTERAIAVNPSHVFADFMADTPSRLVGHAQLALQFLRGHAVARRGEQEHGVKPLLQGCPGAGKGRPGHRVYVMPAPLADIGRFLAEPMELAVLPALRAVALFAVANLHKMVQAGIVVREAIEELLDVEWLSHCLSPYPSNIGYRST